MRIDIVLLVLIIILVAFGFTIAELIEAKQDLIIEQSLISDLTAQRDALKNQNQSLLEQIKNMEQDLQKLREQFGVLMQETEPLKTKMAELQRELDQRNLECLENTPNAALQNAVSAEQSGQIFGEVLTWIISVLVTLGTLLKALVSRIRGKESGGAISSPSNKYVHITEEECNLIIKYRRKH